MRIPPSARIAILALVLFSFGPLAAGRAVPQAALPPLPPLPQPVASLPGGSSSGTSGNKPDSPANSSAASSQPERSTSARYSQALQRGVVAEVNRARRSFGRSPLRLSPQLLRAGQEHARELALHGLFTHDWSNGAPFRSWIQLYYPRTRRSQWRAGENLAWATPELSAAHTIDMWLASPPHRVNLLDRRWNQIGIGVVEAFNAGGIYGGRDVVLVAAEFGVRGGPQR
jgi:uncharacterized protein YkwD